LDKDDDALPLSEIKAIEMFQDKNIKFYGYAENIQAYYVILEHCDEGDLFNFIKDCDEEYNSIDIFKDCLLGLKKCHDKGYFHGDIKPENFIMKNGRPYLIDFGCTFSEKENKSMGTLEYRAPEILPGKKGNNTIKSDIWACGLVLYRLTYKRSFFNNYLGMSDTIKDIQSFKGFNPIDDKDLSLNIIKQCLEVNPNDRPTIDDLLQLLV
jgi:serine/threonine protein kinase